MSKQAQADVLEMRVSPFQGALTEGYDGWYGSIIALDGCATDAPVIGDVVEVVGSHEEGGWDGESCAVLRLADGRYMAWETTWGPTGDGFCADAYGGDADIYVSRDLPLLLRMGLSDAARAAIGKVASR